MTYLHPALEPVLKRTLGRAAVPGAADADGDDVGGCTGDDADLLRRAMGSKRGLEKIERLRRSCTRGWPATASPGSWPTTSTHRIQAFANFGFAESHAISFGLLVYASSWLKLHYPGAFLAGLLRAQPMGFYSPQSLVADARRHGVRVLRPDIGRSGVHAELEGAGGPTGPESCLLFEQPPVGPFSRSTPDPTPEHRRDGTSRSGWG